MTGTAPNAGKKYAAQILTPDEIQALIAQCSLRAPTGVRNRAMITLMYRSGLRVSEVMSLRVVDVNFKKHSIRLLDTKTGEPQTRGFHPSADDALLRWIETRKTLGIKSGALFCTLQGGPVHPQYARNLLTRIGQKAGLEKRVHPHALRHTYAVELEAAGLPVSKISKLLGHSSIAITARYLDHLSNDEAVSALTAIELPELERPAKPGTTRTARKPSAGTLASDAALRALEAKLSGEAS